MYRGATVAVVVPAYDEAAHLAGVVETLPTFVDQAYLVDDASTDDTWAVATDLADRRVTPDGTDDLAGVRATSAPARARTAAMAAGAVGPEDDRATGVRRDADDGLTVVATRHPENRGVGAAIKTGYRLALAGGADVVAVMAGDGQMDPDYLDDVLDPVVSGRAEYAKGTRFSTPEHTEGMSRFRRFGTRLLTLLTRMSTGYWDVEDTQNGYTAISARALVAVRLDDLYDRYGFLNDLLSELARHEMPVAEVSHPARYGDERSAIAYRSLVPRLSVLLLVNFLARLRRMAASDPLDPALLGYAIALVGVGATGLAGGATLLPSTTGTVPGWLLPTALLVATVGVVAGVLADAASGTRASATPGRREIGDGGGRE